MHAYRHAPCVELCSEKSASVTVMFVSIANDGLVTVVVE